MIINSGLPACKPARPDAYEKWGYTITFCMTILSPMLEEIILTRPIPNVCNSGSLQTVDNRAFPNIGHPNNPYCDGCLDGFVAGIVFQKLQQILRTQTHLCTRFLPQSHFLCLPQVLVLLLSRTFECNGGHFLSKVFQPFLSTLSGDKICSNCFEAHSKSYALW